jgi:hypothetical protein
MRDHLTNRGRAAQIAAMTFYIIGMLLASGPSSDARDEHNTAPRSMEACADDNGGITLPAGFCATVFADNVGHARHLVVAPARQRELGATFFIEMAPGHVSTHLVAALFPGVRAVSIADQSLRFATGLAARENTGLLQE